MIAKDNYKIIVYKKEFFTIATKNRVSKKVYFRHIKTYHNIHKSILSKEYIKVWAQYQNTCYHITSILENEQDTIIDSYNKKVEKYLQLIS
jgi:hypothetical protein